jgi:hypothetical protein
VNVEHEEKRADEWERDREAWNLPPRALSSIAVQDRYPVDASPRSQKEPRARPLRLRHKSRG